VAISWNHFKESVDDDFVFSLSYSEKFD